MANRAQTMQSTAQMEVTSQARQRTGFPWSHVLMYVVLLIGVVVAILPFL